MTTGLKAATWTARELAVVLRVSPDAIYEAARRNELPGAIRIGRRLVFSSCDCILGLIGPKIELPKNFSACN